LKHWGTGVFRRIKNSNSQNRCLLLKGGQGIGKDTLVKHMFSDFQPYFETAALSGQPKDVYELISRLYILHIEEFDQTKNLDVAFIKSIITQGSAFFRESYGRAPSRKNVAVSFVSTANVDDILRDPTGNRRFLVVPVTAIDWNYPQGQSGQVLAQLLSLFEAGQFAVLPDALELKVKDILDAFTPPDTNEIILEMYVERAQALVTRMGEVRLFLSQSEIGPAMADIARINGVGINRVRTVVKVNGYSRQQSGGGKMQYFAHPVKAKKL
jgi:predicted P-loop ATPase